MMYDVAISLWRDIMSRSEQKDKIRKNRILCNIITILFTITCAFLIYNILLLGPIEPILRYILVAILILAVLRCLISRTLVIRGTKKKIVWFSVLHILFTIIFLVISIYIFIVYTSVNTFNKSSTNYSTSLVVLQDSSLEEIKDVKDTAIGMIDDPASYEGNTLALEIIEDEELLDDNEIKEYDDYHALLKALYSQEVDVVFLPTSYVSMFDSLDDYKNIEKETRIIYTKTKKVKKNSSSSTIDGPFTVLLMGIDSTSETLSASETGNSDTLMVISFNPDTLSATMLSIPRDSYVDITCMSKKNKITHAGWYGEACVEETIENFLDIDIDYYVKVNFKALVNIVNALGGIEVDVPQDLCTDNSNRTGQVCIKEGKQTLNGEEALVLARNRKQLANGDIDRGLNQQLVVKGILNAAGEKITSISTMYSLLDTISGSIDTNFTTEQILSFYNVGKNIIKQSHKSVTDSLTIRQLYLSGEGKYIYDTATGLNLYNYVLYDESIEAVSNAINANLGKQDAEMIKTFAWSIDEDYESIPIGKITSGSTSNAGDTTSTNKQPAPSNKEEKEESTQDEQNTLVTLPNFIGQNRSNVEAWCNANNVYVTFTYQDVDSTYTQDQVLSQDVSAGTDITTMSSLKIVLANVKEEITTTPPSDETEEEQEDTQTNTTN